MKAKPIFASLILIMLTLLFFWKILLTNLILVGVDTFLYFYPYKSYAAEVMRQGQLPLWNPYLFMGAPLLANSQVGLFYPLNWLFLWLDAPKQVAWSIGLHIALAGGLMLAFTRQSLGLSWLGSMTAAILFAFGGTICAQVEHVNQLNGAAWLPLLFLLYDLGINSSRQRHWFLLMALVVALTLLAGHAQTTFISLFGLGLYGLWQAGEGITHYDSILPRISRMGESANGRVFTPTPGPSPSEGEGRLLTPSPDSGEGWGGGSLQPCNLAYSWQKMFFRGEQLQLFTRLLAYLTPLIVVSILAVALAAIQLLPTAELSGLSIRRDGLTFQEVVSFSTNPTLLAYSLLPPFGVDLTQIFGETFSEWVAYLGISGLLLALWGGLSAIWQVRARRFVFVAACGLGLSFGLFLGPLYLVDVYVGINSSLFYLLARLTHPYYLLYRLVPGFALFRVPARWLLLYAFGMAVLAGFGMDRLADSRSNDPHYWRYALFISLPLLFLMGTLLWNPPALFTLTVWLTLFLVTGTLIFAPTFPLPRSMTMLIILTIELFCAAQSLNYNQPTAPQAYNSMRNSVAFLRSVTPPTGVPDRFLSLSGITYDPGDYHDMAQIYKPALSPQAFYKLVVATKQKEVLFFNLPLLYRLYSVDGYDGGILPLSQFVTMQKLFLPANNLSTDGRLREKLRHVPSGRLLSLINARWIITDKVFDAWIDGIFYDLQFPSSLSPGETISTTDIPPFPATAIGLVSHFSGAAILPPNTLVAKVTVMFGDGSSQTFNLKAGVDTTDSISPAKATHLPIARPKGLSQSKITQISVTATITTGQFILRGLSLIHQPTQTSRSIILSTEGNYHSVHSGDVKIYENRAVLPRAYIVHQAKIVSTDDEAITMLQDPDFPIADIVLLKGSPKPLPTGDLRGDDSKIVSYKPERVEITATLASSGWLVLSDTYYPGWQATVDGQPAEISQANVMFRAVALSAGEHTVLFEFKPRSLQIGAWVSGMTLVGLLIGLGKFKYRHIEG